MKVARSATMAEAERISSCRRWKCPRMTISVRRGMTMESSDSVGEMVSVRISAICQRTAYIGVIRSQPQTAASVQAAGVSERRRLSSIFQRARPLTPERGSKI